mmetsp:Transcript_9784/g.16469  ORF Transcript_9784/g.16469 Transcript_9784/m.16469 type:complete len:310 (-) Transcript_9784:21-950(-)
MYDDIQLKTNEEIVVFGVTAVGIVASVFTRHPFELFGKAVMLQPELVRISDSKAAPYNTTVEAYSYIKERRGLVGFWKGAWLSVFTQFPDVVATQILQQPVRFINATMRRWTTGHSRSIIVSGSLLAGTLIGGLSAALMYPFRVAQIQYEMDGLIGKPRFEKAFDAVKQTFTSSNYVRDWLTAMPSAFAGILVYRVSYFTLVEFFSRFQTAAENQFLVGLSVAVTATALAYPFDLIGRRMMLASGTKHRYTSTTECAQQIYDERGWRGFWSGAGVETGATLVGYGASRAVLQGVNALLPLHWLLRVTAF